MNPSNHTSLLGIPIPHDTFCSGPVGPYLNNHRSEYTLPGEAENMGMQNHHGQQHQMGMNPHMETPEPKPVKRKKKVPKKPPKEKKEPKFSQTEAKQKRNLGLAYYSCKSKKIVPARTIGQRCNDGCFESLTMPVIETIFRNFWEIGNFDEQNAYIQRMVESVPIKRKRTKSVESLRTQNFHYRVIHDGVSYPVCRAGFLSIHGLTKARINTAIGKQSESGVLVKDCRGKHTPANKVVGVAAEKVREHINLLQTWSPCNTHNIRHHPRRKLLPKKYLPQFLTVDKIYHYYLDWMDNTNPTVKKVSKSYYGKTFRDEFNISFSSPRTKTCRACEKLEAENAMKFEPPVGGVGAPPQSVNKEIENS